MLLLIIVGLKQEDGQRYHLGKPPMTDPEFRYFMDAVGHMVRPDEFRLMVYQGGVEPSLRSVVWRHLLNVYPEGLSGRERFEYQKRKCNEYYKLRDEWRDLFSKGRGTEEMRFIANMVKKDVLRTDRTHKFYAGSDDSANVLSLFNILVTYALTHPDVSYCQGMSDIASPILVVQQDEATAYLCFAGLMKRMRKNFSIDGSSMSKMFQHLALVLRHRDPDFYAYLKSHDAHDMFFCYRWIILELKREFPLDDALLMLEIMWSSLPPDPPDTELQLADQEYSIARLICSPQSPSLANLSQTYLRIRSLCRHVKVRTEHEKAEDESRSPTRSNNQSNQTSSAVNYLSSHDSAVTPAEELKSIDPKDFLPMLDDDDTTRDLIDKSSSIEKSLESSDSDSKASSLNEKALQALVIDSELRNQSEVQYHTSVVKQQEGVIIDENESSITEHSKQVEQNAIKGALASATPPNSPKRPDSIILKKTFEPVLDSNAESNAQGDTAKNDSDINDKIGESSVTREHTCQSVSVTENGISEETQVISSCEEVTEQHPSIEFIKVHDKLPRLPPPHEFGDGNPFLMFLCLTLLVQERDHIQRNHMDYNELAMHFDKMVRQHDVYKVLHQAQSLYAVYLRAQTMMADESDDEDSPLL